jgi:hypothetical protein
MLKKCEWLYGQADFYKIQTFAPGERAIFFKITLGIFFFYCYESKEPSGDQIREMVATGFGRFYME